MKIKTLITFACMILLVSVSSACNTREADKSEGDKKIQIVTSFYPMYFFTKKVAGDHAVVKNLVPTGVEPHDWEPTARDIALIKNSDVFVYNGAGHESWVEDVLQSVGKIAAVETSKGLELIERSAEEEEEAQEKDGHEEDAAHEEHEHEHEDGLDPHVWLDPVLAQKQVQSIQKALEKADSAHKQDFKKNADAIISELQKLDKEYKEALTTAKRKDFVTQHAAFGYLAKQYGLTQVPIAGLSPDHEPTPAKMAEIVKFVKDHDIQTIFFETLVSSDVAETIAKEVGAKTDVLNPIEGLTDEDKANHLDYLDIMRKNLEALKKALNE